MKAKHLSLALLVASLSFLNSCVEKSGCTDPGAFNYDSEATTSDGTCKYAEGCTGFYGDVSNGGSLGNSFNDYNNDQQFKQEVSNQAYFWNGIPATVYVWYEPYGMVNALSTPQGNIQFGYNMFYNTLQNLWNQGYQNADYAIDGILAHEWGHQAQFQLSWMGGQSTLVSELEADCFSGFYIAAGKQWDNSAVQAYVTNVYYSGNYDFTNPSFHGTPDQRASAADYGIQLGIDMLSGTNYSYNDMHDLFTSYIHSTILRKMVNADEHNKFIKKGPDGKTLVQGITYPTVTKKVQVHQ